MNFIILLAVIFAIICYLLKKVISEPFRFWQKKGIPFLKPTIPIGNFAIFSNKSLVELVNDIYFKVNPKCRFMGVYQFLLPVIMLRDPELVKEISVKESDSYIDHRQLVPEGLDPLWNAGLVWLQGEKWRYMRNTLSPAFTGNKMRMLFGLMNDCARQVATYIGENSPSGIFHAEMESIFKGYTNDVFATCAFGVKTDSLQNPNNEFYNKVSKAVAFRGMNVVKFFLCNLCPSLMKLFGIKMITDSSANFFTGIIVETLKKRRQNNIIRPDILHLLMEAQKGNLKDEDETEGESEKQKIPITDQDIIGQSLLFLLGGYESVSVLINFTFYELAVNPEIQKKLYEEIRGSVVNSELNYDLIVGMKYLNMVVSEVLRKWSPVPYTDRVATKTTVIKGKQPGEKDCVIEKGFVLVVPINSIHHNPDYFPEPEKFNPERFSEENRNTFNHNAYMPFGMGPRFCIGSRFAILETKILVAHLLLKFEVVPIEKTLIPMKLAKWSLGPAPKGGMWLGFKKR